MAELQDFNIFPLDDHMMYLRTVALPNYERFCSAEDYVYHVMGEEVSRGEYLRRFLSAAESLNNTLDYYYWEHEDASIHASDGCFRNRAFTFEPLEKLANIANAYKHAKRKFSSDIQEAKQLVKEPFASFILGNGIKPEAISARLSGIVPREFVANLQAGGEFWRKYVKDLNNRATVHATLQNFMLKNPK